eukprot:CAMPEP_0196577064 /NCGR_PEP_ID=MMETSP1081-20130531/6201_1 /TAXON_ID=36882 /ORGANISM="Pyramimonas amylifera, Strain CCMP720" /LENGTH=243 /DNA_ID=CAMNT_0041895869 /DNA_START=570 /DNA_END=1301 /DNA_ORIENTATION=+
MNAPADPDDNKERDRKEIVFVVCAALAGGVFSVILNRVLNPSNRARRRERKENNGKGKEKKMDQFDRDVIYPAISSPIPMNAAVIGHPLGSLRGRSKSDSDHTYHNIQDDGASSSGCQLKVPAGAEESTIDEGSPCSSLRSEEIMKKAESIQLLEVEDLYTLHATLASTVASQEIHRLAADQAKKKSDLLKLKAQEMAVEAAEAAEEAQHAFEDSYEVEMAVKKIEMKIRALEQDGETPSYIS